MALLVAAAVVLQDRLIGPQAAPSVVAAATELLVPHQRPVRLSALPLVVVVVADCPQVMGQEPEAQVAHIPFLHPLQLSVGPQVVAMETTAPRTRSLFQEVVVLVVVLVLSPDL